MAVAEFGLIDRYFKSQRVLNASTDLGMGDDCALLQIPAGYQLAITTDTMVENIHFLPDANPEWLGHKLLAVNLSDLASMGAKPLSVLLALTLPKIDEQWLQGFARGFLNLAQRFEIDLIGGDTTTGSLTLTVQALGLVPNNTALKRSAAQVGDIVCVTGQLGDAGLGLKIAQGHYHCANPELPLQRLHQPEPRVNSGLALRNIAHACIDISDGLVADLSHITAQSGVGACIEFEQLPLSLQVKHYIAETHDWQLPLTAGDDYELCFTVSPDKLKILTIPHTPIGTIDNQSGVRVIKSGKVHSLTRQGYEHFS